MFKWKDSYSVSIPEIDTQHRKLFEIGSRVYELAALQDGFDHYDEIMDILEELRDYTIYHFRYEEKMLEKVGYKGMDEQLIEHAFFIKKLDKICKKDVDSEQEEALTDMLRFTADWITSHILGSDMKYREAAAPGR